MKLNIVTAASNSVWKAILEQIANPEDITIGLSRKGCDIDNVLDCRITDLTNKEVTQRELLKMLSIIDISTIDIIKIFHNCCYAVAEIPNLDKNHSLLKSNPELISKVTLQDLDGDGIDDRAYNSLLTTFRNVFSIISEKYPDKKISIWTICSLTDKKKYIPTVFQSMVKSNKIIREEIEWLARWNIKIQSVCISASTVRTETEENFRKFCTEKEYWVSWETVAHVLVSEMKEHDNVYKDIDLYIPHPQYNEYYKDETDNQMTERLKKEIGLI